MPLPTGGWCYEVVFYILMQQPWTNPHDFSLYHFPPDVGGLFAALTLKFVAWFFHEAQELQEEQELTVKVYAHHRQSRRGSRTAQNAAE
jgi:hypothetical protein